MKRERTPELLQGTLDVMILSVLVDNPMHGYAIAREIERRSGGVLSIEEGSLYPALHRMAKRGDIVPEWRTTETGRRARVYRLTIDGRQQLSAQASLWAKISGAVTGVLRAGADPIPGSRSALA
jgi:transcriptional regulator